MYLFLDPSSKSTINRYSQLVRIFARHLKASMWHRSTCNSPGTVSTAEERERNSGKHDRLPSVDDIAEIAENETEENAILIARAEISCLDDLSIEGDIPEDVSDIEYEIDS